jgi:hypothetical protein
MPVLITAIEEVMLMGTDACHHHRHHLCTMAILPQDIFTIEDHIVVMVVTDNIGS